MYSYASRVEPDDRWRIVAYIRALQRSQNAGRGDMDEKDSRFTDAAKKQIDSFVPPPSGNRGQGTGNSNSPGAGGTGSATNPAPLADTPVPNTPANGARQPAPGTPPQGTVNAPGAPNGGNTPGTPANGGAMGAPTNTMPGGATGSGTIRHRPGTVSNSENQGGLRPPSANQSTPPSAGASQTPPSAGGNNGTGNR